MTEDVWDVRRPWAELRATGEETLSPDQATRARIAEFLDLEGLDRLTATVRREPWLDGARVHGRIEAVAIRMCGVSLDLFEEQVDAAFDLRFVPEGSANAPAPAAELIVNLDEDDPPDVVRGDTIDLASHLIEVLGLAVEPFPRKPGAVFDYSDAAAEPSPFAILKSALPRNRD